MCNASMYTVSVSQCIKELFHFIKISGRNIVDTWKEQSRIKLQINNYIHGKIKFVKYRSENNFVESLN